VAAPETTTVRAPTAMWHLVAVVARDFVLFLGGAGIGGSKPLTSTDRQSHETVPFSSIPALGSCMSNALLWAVAHSSGVFQAVTDADAAGADVTAPAPISASPTSALTAT
jgi:hypothetical protein